MCGITGLIVTEGSLVDTALLAGMTGALKHRGPDDEGYLLLNTASGHALCAGGPDTPGICRESPYRYSPSIDMRDVSPGEHGCNLGFGYRRLSIIDLSPAGHQPMCSRDGSRWIVYNGEVYNYIELRRELQDKGHVFDTASDTEVVLHAYDEWGYDCLEKFNGMWAFALWDGRSRTLFCARDRFGVKPFYYYADGSRFAFASEIKSLLAHPVDTARADDTAVYNYLRWGFIGYSSGTFFEGIKQLGPGHYLTVDCAGKLSVKRWWRLYVNHVGGRFSTEDGGENASRLFSLLEDSVRVRLRSDVPVGTCLSGGLDSSSIVCLANRLMFDGGALKMEIVGSRQKTFSACHEDGRYDERKFIQIVLDATSAEGNFIFPSGEGLWDELPQLIRHQDEPFGSTSIYAQWCVMKRVRERGVKVLLDGQGGDEVLAGYQPYYGTFLLDLLRRGAAASFIREAECIAGITGFGGLSRLVLQAAAARFYASLPGRMQALGASINETLKGSLVHRMINRDMHGQHFGQSSSVLSGMAGSYLDLQARLAHDLATSLAVLLRYEDRNSMAFSVEARVPFLDYRLVEFAFSVPYIYKIHEGWSKWLLRQAMEGVMPESVRLRKDKLGFPTPQLHWLRQNRDNIMGLFSDQGFKAARHIDNRYIVAHLDRLLVDESSAADLWRFINLEFWMRAFEL